MLHLQPPLSTTSFRWAFRQCTIGLVVLGALISLTTGHLVVQAQEGIAPHVSEQVQAPATASEAETSEKLSLYIYSYDYPPSWYYKGTRTVKGKADFQTHLENAIAETPLFSLVPLAVNANYQVNLRCGGFIDCDKLIVDVYDPKGNLANSFKIRTRKWPVFLGAKEMSEVTKTLFENLEKQLSPSYLSNHPTLRYK